MARILIVDDEANICWALRAYLEGEGHDVAVAASADEALKSLETAPPDVVVSDIRLPGMTGIQILERFQAVAPTVPVILMTAYGHVGAAVDAMHKGAFEYLHKPVDLVRLKAVIERALASGHAALVCEGDTVAEEAEPPSHRLVGRSVAMQELYKLIGLVSRSSVAVLIEGESGVGKELVARAIHDYSARRDGPFVAINCASVPEALLESELFGYERGAFTGAHALKPGRYELANGGTLFLDELVELSPTHQTKLLRVLQDGLVERLGGTRSIPVDVRVIAASSRSIREAVLARQFREDLYFRLQVVTIMVPPLRERKDDLAHLVAHFVRLAARETGRELRGLDAAAMAAIHRHDWPGNVRELENAIRRAAALARGSVIGVADLPSEVVSASSRTLASVSELEAAAEAELRARVRDADAEGAGGSVYHDLVEAVESRLVRTALEITGGNQVRAADLLGVTRTTLRKRMSPGSKSEAGQSGDR
jgi:nitrogen regulation protein NR(I)